MATKGRDVDIKVVMLGDSGVGKTSLLIRFLENTFGNTKTTIGASFFKKAIQSKKSGKSIELGLWDTAGQERYDSLSSFYCRHTNVALICYDVTDKQTFQNIQKWYQKLTSSAPASDCFVILIGTKSDLGNSTVSKDDLQHKFSQCDLIIKHYTTSAKTGENISDIFDLIVEEWERRTSNSGGSGSNTPSHNTNAVPISQVTTSTSTRPNKGCCG
ncbi:hypothetical protein ABK040_015484 [Willaertia magna]